MPISRIALAFLGVVFCATVSARAEDDLLLARTAFLARQSTLQSIVVNFHTVTEDTPDVAKMEALLSKTGIDRSRVVIRTGKLERRTQFSFLSGRLRIIEKLTPESAAKAREMGRVDLEEKRVVLAPGRRESLVKQLNEPQLAGVISDSSEIPDTAIDVALGLRRYGGTVWLDAAEIGKAKFSLDAKELVVTLEGSTGHHHLWRCNPDFGYAPTLYELKRRDGNTVIRVENSDFRATDGVMLPFHSVMRRYNVSPNFGTIGSVMQTVELSVQKYSVSDPANTPDSYKMVWPVGSSVLDNRTGENFVIGSGDRTLDDAAIRAEADANQRALERARQRIDAVSATQPTPTQP